MSAATVGQIVLKLSEELQRDRTRRLYPNEYNAPVVDAIYGKYRNRGDAALLVAIGVRWDGSFDVIDWQAAESESTEATETLLTRVWKRRLTDLSLFVADGSGALQSAKEIVYPETEFQLCLWHWIRTLRAHVSPDNRRRFARDFWEVYNGLDRAEVASRARRFKRRWKRKEPEAIEMFGRNYPDTLGYLMFPARWRHRVRTVNLAEGFFRNFRRFFNRFPGFKHEEHISRVLGLYLLGAKPERWRPRQFRIVA